MLPILRRSSNLIVTRCRAGLWFTVQISGLTFNHRMAEDGKEHLPNPSGLQKQLSGPRCLGSCPGGRWLSPWWRLHNLFVPVLHCPDSKKVFPDVQMEPPVYQFLSHLKKEQKTNQPNKSWLASILHELGAVNTYLVLDLFNRKGVQIHIFHFPEEYYNHFRIKVFWSELYSAALVELLK